METKQGNDDHATLTYNICKEIHESVEKTDSMSSSCICMVPEKLRKVKEIAYTPQLVSIGPLHSSKDHLKSPMEDIKKSYVDFLLNRMMEEEDGIEKKASALRNCVEKMYHSMDKAKKYYAENVELDVKMLVIDGCFILEFLHRNHHNKFKPQGEPQPARNDGCFILELLCRNHHHGEPHPEKIEQSSSSSSSNQTGKQDLIFDYALTRVAIRNDLMLLENQLPLFVLKELFDLTVALIPNPPINPPPSFSELVISCFGDIMMNSPPSPPNPPPSLYDGDWAWTSSQKQGESEEANHILHFLHKHYVPPGSMKGRGGIGSKSWEFEHCSMPPASELEYAGVKFEAETKDNHLFNVQFGKSQSPFGCCRRNRFKIPKLRISDSTDVLLRNLIAFEQCYLGVERYFTSYAVFMDRLISTADDVQVLEKAGVISSSLGTRGETSDLFNKLCKEIPVPRRDFYFAETCSKVTGYSKHTWPASMAYLRRKCFENPWTVIAFCIGFITFGFTVEKFISSFVA